MKSFSANILVLIVSLLILSCGRNSAPASTPEATPEAAPQRAPYTPPVPPAVITSPEKRIEYLTERYWDLFDFADTTVWSDREYIRSTFTRYFKLLDAVPDTMAEQSVSDMLRHAESDSTAFANTMELCEDLLDNPNSPMRNESLYIHVLRRLLASDRLDEYEKIRPAHRLEMSLKNRPGDVAADFTYVDIGGRPGTLHTIKAPFTLIFFNNPDCTSCKTLREAISASKLLSGLIAHGRLKVLALYPDQEIKAWTDYAPQIPAEWINARDPESVIRDGAIYDLRAIPSLYLLDRDKRVLVKDASEVNQIEQAIKRRIRR